MSRRWIVSLVSIGALLVASRGVCHERVRRPVVRFIDFYKAAEKAPTPLSFWERITYGMAIAVEDPQAPTKCPTQ